MLDQNVRTVRAVIAFLFAAETLLEVSQVIIFHPISLLIKLAFSCFIANSYYHPEQQFSKTSNEEKNLNATKRITSEYRYLCDIFILINCCCCC